MSEQLRSLASLWRGGSKHEASYADDIFDLLEERDALRAQVAALTSERDAAVHMLAIGVEAYFGSGDMRFWAMGAEAMVRRLSATPAPEPGDGGQEE